MTLQNVYMGFTTDSHTEMVAALVALCYRAETSLCTKLNCSLLEMLLKLSLGTRDTLAKYYSQVNSVLNRQQVVDFGDLDSNPSGASEMLENDTVMLSLCF